ncbi:DUF6000 family protein [Amycolatopsis albispora]|uniref:Uncharacterized protein n=1 Tax=Amycolatopsis albispora TaxID=1804986 RepID=A0A344L366_9PSEU|nr:DUF6000 family protein [Amycolatopsis albispora]AXB42490.1 hypothetical protein A4R43_08095 [Amycolatopsis albispora]
MTGDVYDRYVVGAGERPRYSQLLHANFVGLGPGRDEFVRQLIEAAGQVTDDELTRLLADDWRSKITAAWLIGVGRRAGFRQRIGELLLESQYVYAGQGYCYALARLGTTADAAILATYLDRYLRRLDARYDQEWALAALRRVDAGLGQRYATQFTWPGGPWHAWAAANRVEREDGRDLLVFAWSLIDDAERG